MKKGLLVSILSLLCFTTAMAQEQDPWVGTWTSESYRDVDWIATEKTETVVWASFKLVVRITKSGDQYNIRAKTIRPDDPNYSIYRLPFTIKRMVGNTILLESYEKKVRVTDDWYYDITYYYKLTLKDGTLHYSFYKQHSVDYDRNMRYKGEKDNDVSEYRRVSELDLFNDDW